MGKEWSQKLVAEAFGVFALVFAGCGAIVVNKVSGGAVTHVGIALTFGLVVLALIYALGDVSGAHFNPAVTIGFVVARRLEWEWAGPYILAQCVGAVLACVALRVVFPESATLGETQPAGGEWQSFVLEILLTMFLMFVVLNVIDGPKVNGPLVGVAVGAVIGLEALFAGPISGASMNPARSLGPALVGWKLNALWVYLTAPVLGACAGVLAHWCVRPGRSAD